MPKLDKLIISCQGLPQSVLLWYVGKAKEAGVNSVRLGNPDDVVLVKERYPSMVVLGCYKDHQLSDRVYITPTVKHAQALAEAGADFIAFDATCEIKRPEKVSAMVETICEAGKIPVADIKTPTEGRIAQRLQVKYVATTLCAGGLITMVSIMSSDGLVVIAEGGIDTPDKARQCFAAGAAHVCVGAAITKPKEVISGYMEVVA